MHRGPLPARHWSFLCRPSHTSAYAQELFVFGQQGSGPDYFSNSRDVAVDAAGNIYVAEYLNGRMQTFDTQGKFLIQWQVELTTRHWQGGRPPQHSSPDSGRRDPSFRKRYQ